MKLFKVVASAAIALSLFGCSSLTQTLRAPGQHSVLVGPPVAHNETPYTRALSCISDRLPNKRISITVGTIEDLTGKYSDQNGGYRVTQGSNLMAINALMALSPVQVVERTDLGVFNFDMDMSNQELLSDGKKLRALLAGQVNGSDYYITGGVTELNDSITSGGAELDVSGIFMGRRIYVLNVAVDLRIVDTRNLNVVKAFSRSKQVVGIERKAGGFEFFRTHLFDLNTGDKRNEPLQLGIRAIMESTVGELVASVYGVDPSPCLDNAEQNFYDYLNSGDRRVGVLPLTLASTTKPVETCQTRSTPFTTGEGTMFALVSSFRKTGTVQKHAESLAVEHPSVFAGRAYQSIATGTCNGEWYGLYYGPFEDKAAAHDFCSSVHSTGNECIVKKLKHGSYQ